MEWGYRLKWYSVECHRAPASAFTLSESTSWRRWASPSVSLRMPSLVHSRYEGMG